MRRNARRYDIMKKSELYSGDGRNPPLFRKARHGEKPPSQPQRIFCEKILLWFFVLFGKKEKKG